MPLDQDTTKVIPRADRDAFVAPPALPRAGQRAARLPAGHNNSNQQGDCMLQTAAIHRRRLDRVGIERHPGRCVADRRRRNRPDSRRHRRRCRPGGSRRPPRLRRLGGNPRRGTGRLAQGDSRPAQGARRRDRQRDQRGNGLPDPLCANRPGRLADRQLRHVRPPARRFRLRGDGRQLQGAAANRSASSLRSPRGTTRCTRSRPRSRRRLPPVVRWCSSRPKSPRSMP